MNTLNCSSSVESPEMEVAPDILETYPEVCEAIEILDSPVEALEHYFKMYAALSPGLPLVLALWSMSTYLFESFDCFPYAAITSPTKRCGKTRVAELLELVCDRPLRTVGISPAALFRVVAKRKPTLIVDEAESLRSKGDRAEALREILNAGYRKGQRVIRCKGKDGNYDTFDEFETFGPKVLILIGRLPDTLADRCITIEMKRRVGEQLERFRFERVKKEAQPIRQSIEEWKALSGDRVTHWYQTNDPEFLEDREAELWLPLFAVCAVAAPERMPELEILARHLSGLKADIEPGDFGIKLLTDIHALFLGARCDRLPTADLLSELRKLPESPWHTWSDGRGLDARSLSHLLRPFGVRPKNLRLGEVVKGYEKAEFEDAWSRYLPILVMPEATPAT